MSSAPSQLYQKILSSTQPLHSQSPIPFIAGDPISNSNFYVGYNVAPRHVDLLKNFVKPNESIQGIFRDGTSYYVVTDSRMIHWDRSMGEHNIDSIDLRYFNGVVNQEDMDTRDRPIMMNMIETTMDHLKRITNTTSPTTPLSQSFKNWVDRLKHRMAEYRASIRQRQTQRRIHQPQGSRSRLSTGLQKFQTDLLFQIDSLRNRIGENQKNSDEKKINIPTIILDGYGEVRICCNQTARLKEIYCHCGKAIPNELIKYYH